MVKINLLLISITDNGGNKEEFSNAYLTGEIISSRFLIT